MHEEKVGKERRGEMVRRETLFADVNGTHVRTFGEGRTTTLQPHHRNNEFIVHFFLSSWLVNDLCGLARLSSIHAQRLEAIIRQLDRPGSDQRLAEVILQVLQILNADAQSDDVFGHGTLFAHGRVDTRMTHAARHGDQGVDAAERD